MVELLEDDARRAFGEEESESQRQLAIGLVVVAVVVLAYGALSFGFAAYIWGRLTTRA